jgi:ribosomal protein S18 acetylase RimI-like enzyme
MPCDGPVGLRRATVDDAQGIAEVHVRSWRAAYRDLLPHELLAGLSVERRQGFWHDELRLVTGDHRPWIADHQGTVVGFVSAGLSRDDDASGRVGEIYAIYVDPDCWSRGIGRNLLGHATRDLTGHGFHAATLWVIAENELARPFYEAAGWHTDGATRVETLGGAEVTEVRYRRELS